MATIMNDNQTTPIPLQQLHRQQGVGAAQPDLSTPELRAAFMANPQNQAAYRAMIAGGFPPNLDISGGGGGSGYTAPRSKWWLWGSLIVLGIAGAGLAGWWYKKKYMDKGKPRRALPPPREPNRRSPGGSSGVPAFMRGSRKANRKRSVRKSTKAVPVKTTKKTRTKKEAA